jgi:hypothetical protein
MPPSLRRSTISIALLLFVVAGCDKPRRVEIAGPKFGPVDWSAERIAEETKHVHDDLRKMDEALAAGDFVTVLSYSPPRYIEKMGGLEAGKAGLQKIMSEGKERGVAMPKTVYGEPTFLRSANMEFVMVPVTASFQENGADVEVVGHMLGGREWGKQAWKYVEPEGMRAEKLYIFPEFPDDYPIPERKKRVVAAP